MDTDRKKQDPRETWCEALAAAIFLSGLELPESGLAEDLLIQVKGKLNELGKLSENWAIAASWEALNAAD